MRFVAFFRRQASYTRTGRRVILKCGNICRFIHEKQVKTTPYCGICWQIFTFTSLTKEDGTAQATAVQGKASGRPPEKFTGV
jgi:ribosomal protein L34E